MLAEGEASKVVVALHFARQVLRIARKTGKLVKDLERAQVILHFDNGASKTEAFLAKLRGDLMLVQQQVSAAAPQHRQKSLPLPSRQV